MFKFTKYFVYLAYNWNIKIARHIIVDEVKSEKKYGINTTGADELNKLKKKGIDISHATIYMPVSYELVEEAFKQLRLLFPAVDESRGISLNHFVDIGCGKGRALCVASWFGFRKLTGIDFSEHLCSAARNNLLLTRRKFPSIDFSVINNDAFYFEIPKDADCIFLFNPFDEIILSGVVGNLDISLHMYPRKIAIVYINPLHKDQLLKAGFKESFYITKMKYLELSIFTN